jgi:hypothetical protein
MGGFWSLEKFTEFENDFPRYVSLYYSFRFNCDSDLIPVEPKSSGGEFLHVKDQYEIAAKTSKGGMDYYHLFCSFSISRAALCHLQRKV